MVLNVACSGLKGVCTPFRPHFLQLRPWALMLHYWPEHQFISCLIYAGKIKIGAVAK